MRLIPDLRSALVPGAQDVGEGSPLDRGSRGDGQVATGKSKTLPERRDAREDIPADCYGPARSRLAGIRATGRPLVVAETGMPDRIGLAEIVVEVDGIEERPPRVAGVLGRNGQDVVQSLPAPRRDDQHPETVRRSLVLQLLVQANLPLPTVGVLVGADSLRAVVQFDEEIELLPVTGVQLEGAIGKQVLLGNLEPQGVLPGELLHFDALPMGGDQRMDDELGEAVRVVLVGEGDFVEVPLRRRLALAP